VITTVIKTFKAYRSWASAAGGGGFSAAALDIGCLNCE